MTRKSERAGLIRPRRVRERKTLFHFLLLLATWALPWQPAPVWPKRILTVDKQLNYSLPGDE